MGESILTTSRSRIDTIDVLRGFALAGILYAHMIIWYTGAALPPEVYTRYDSTADNIAFAIFGALVLGKFFSVFSFLFGLSFFLHLRKNRSKPNYLRVYIWRLFLLFLIGLVHHIFWRGDILAIYAFLGIILIFFRKLSPKLLLFIAFLLVINVPTHIYDALGPEAFKAEVEFPMAEEAERYYSLVQKEGLRNVLVDNWNSWPAKVKYQLESGRLSMTFGYFILGLYAGRMKLFTSNKENLLKLRNWNKYSEKAVLVLLLVGILFYAFNLVTLPNIRVVPEYKWISSFLFSIYNTCLTIFYITGIALLFQIKFFRFFLRPFALMGRMALTNYLLQTAFGLLLFYSFGFGLFDRTSPAINVLLGIMIFYLQLKFSQWWLHNYQQGPIEWLWKGFTYFRFSSIKREKQKKV